MGSIPIIGIIIIAVAAILSLFILIVMSGSQTKTVRPFTRPLFALLLVVLTGSTMSLLGIFQSTHPAKPINDDVKIIDAVHQLSIRSIAMSATSYVSDEGAIKKTYRQKVAVDVVNNSSQELYLGLKYYTSSDSMGSNSPDATSEAKILQVPSRWSGQLQYPLQHLQLVKRGSIKLILFKCDAAGLGGFLPGDSERLFEMTYDLVLEQ